MANSNTPFGLKPINQNAGLFTGQLSMYYVPTSVATSVFVGDPLSPGGSGDAYGVADIQLGAAGGTTAGTTAFYLGPMVAVVNGPAAGGNATIPLTRDLPVYHTASTAGYVLVADDPNTLFTVQEDGVGGAIAATGISSNFSMIAGTGSTNTGLSGWLLDSSTTATTTLQMRLMRLTRAPDNAIGTSAKWTVRINQHALWNTVGF